MTQRKQFTMRFAAVALAVGLISPSVSIENTSTSGEDGYSVSISVLNAAEARAHVNHNRNVNRSRNVNHNRHVNHNVNRHNGGHYNGGYNNHHDHTAAKVIGGAVAGAVIVDAVKD